MEKKHLSTYLSVLLLFELLTLKCFTQGFQLIITWIHGLYYEECVSYPIRCGTGCLHWHLVQFHQQLISDPTFTIH